MSLVFLFASIFFFSTIDCWSDIGCLQRKNITLYYDETLVDLTNLIEEIKAQLGVCSTINVIQYSTQKSISIHRHYYMLNWRLNQYSNVCCDLGMFQRISDEMQNIEDNDVKHQFLVIAFNYVLSRNCGEIRNLIAHELKVLQDKGFVIIVFCRSFTREDCPEVTWLPGNRIFDLKHFGNGYLGLHPKTIINSIDVMKNPSFDRVEFSRKVGIDNFDHSRFSNRHIVLHIILIFYYDLLTLVQNAIITANHFKHQEVNFVFYTLGGPENAYFFVPYIERYGIAANVITVKQSPIYRYYQNIFSDKMHLDRTSTKRNFFLIMDSGSSRQQMCSRSQATLKNVYFYSGSIYYDPIKPCDDKTLTNIHETVDLYNQEHFMEEINKIACDGAQKIEL